MSNRIKISINATNRIRLIKISAVLNCIKIGANLILQLTKISANLIPQLTKISAVLNCIKISADYIHIIAKSSSIIRILYAKANRTGRVLIKRVFNNKVI
jgi:hypothetical protein